MTPHFPPSSPLSTTPRHKRALAAVGLGASVEWETFARNPDGTVVPLRKAKRNLILDQGLDYFASQLIVNCTRYCAVGTGTNPIKRDSGAITFSRAGTTVTSSANFFEAGDVGRLLKFDTGEEMKVTAYTDPQNVTVDTSGALGAAEGTVYYVNRTGLQTETARTGNLRTDAGDNQSTFSVDTWTHKRTFLFPAVGGNVTYNEIGWSPSSGAGANLFGMDLISGGDSLLTGQQYIVIVRLSVKVSPASGVAVGDVGNNGFDTSGTAKMESVALGDGQGFIGLNSAGNASGGYANLEPSHQSSLSCATMFRTLDFTQQAITSGTIFDSDNVQKNATASTYTPGTFFRDFTSAAVAVNEANGSIYGICLGRASRNFSVKFTTPQTKAGTHTLAATWRLSWNRVLVN